MVDGLRNLIDLFNVRMCAEDIRAGVKSTCPGGEGLTFQRRR
jgi:hypothetical protein